MRDARFMLARLCCVALCDLRRKNESACSLRQEGPGQASCGQPLWGRWDHVGCRQTRLMTGGRVRVLVCVCADLLFGMHACILYEQGVGGVTSGAILFLIFVLFCFFFFFFSTKNRFQFCCAGGQTGGSPRKKFLGCRKEGPSKNATSQPHHDYTRFVVGHGFCSASPSLAIRPFLGTPVAECGAVPSSDRKGATTMPIVRR